MTTPFTTFAFPATGAPISRTLPDRLAEIKNVKDFGATGNGVSDDLAAIQAAFNWTAGLQRGTIFFPPGTYFVSGPINIGQPSSFNTTVALVGVLGESRIVGNFADYIIKRATPGSTGTIGPQHIVAALTIINQHAAGGGIRFGGVAGGAIRDCNITANFAISTLGDDILVGNFYASSFEISIENTYLKPWTVLASGSTGLVTGTDGPITNCSFVGFDFGVKCLGGEGAMAFQGCYFEGNNTAFAPGLAPGQTAPTQGSSVAGVSVSGCRFKNNKTAIDNFSGFASYFGILIEAVEGSIPGNPQYGIRMRGVSTNHSQFFGIKVTGQYQIAGVFIENVSTAGNRPSNSLKGIHVTNTSTLSGVPWSMPATAFTADFFACNTAPVFTVANLPSSTVAITTIAWSAAVITGLGSLIGGSGYVPGVYANIPLTGGSGTGAIATVVVSGAGVVTTVAIVTVFGSAGGLYSSSQSGGANYVVGDVLSANAANLGGTGSGFSIHVTVVKNLATLTGAASVGISLGVVGDVGVSGVNPSGYNTPGTTADATGVAATKLVYEIASNPGAYVSGGSAFITTAGSNGPNCFEGYCYNISNGNSATWGAPLPSTAGSTHAKVRYTPTAWTVLGI